MEAIKKLEKELEDQRVDVSELQKALGVAIRKERALVNRIDNMRIAQHEKIISTIKGVVGQ